MIVPPPAPPGANGVAQRRNNRRLGGLLHILLWIGTAQVLAGAILALLREGRLPHTTVPIARLAGALATLDGNALLTLGLLVFLASPPIGLIFVTYCFARARDWRFALAAAAVLAIVLGGMALAIP